MLELDGVPVCAIWKCAANEILTVKISTLHGLNVSNKLKTARTLRRNVYICELEPITRRPEPLA